MKPTLLLALLVSASLSAADFRIENSTVLTSSGAFHWAQSRPAILPGRVIVTGCFAPVDVNENEIRVISPRDGLP